VASGRTEQVVRAVVAQTGSFLFDTDRTMSHFEHWGQLAGEHHPDLLVFPEAFIGGYPKGLDFGARVGTRSVEGRRGFERYFNSAIEVPGPECDRIAALAKRLATTLVIGVVERAGRTLFCTALTFSPDGEMIGRHRKLMPTASERLLWGLGDGSTMTVADTPAGRVGTAICWENYMPLYRTALYADGVEFWCAPTVDERDIWQSTMRHIAVEGRCFVLSANQYLSSDHLPADYELAPNADPSAALIGGGSVIVSPMGDVMAGPLRGTEGLLVADLDRSALARGSFDLDTVGHYSRPDIFTLHVDRRSRPGVQDATPTDT
jgi:nitrilase